MNDEVIMILSIGSESSIPGPGTNASSSKLSKASRTWD